MNVCYAVIAIAFQAFVIEYSWKKKRFDGANYGFYLGTSNIILFFGLLVGQALNVLSSSQGVSIFMLLAFVGIYPLGIVLVFALTRSKPQASPEVSAEQGFSAEQYVETFGASASAGGSASTSPVEEDVLRLERFAGKYNLTKRETEIVSFLVKGRAVKHIANSLYLSENTVWTHVKGAYSKTGVHSKEELIEHES